MQREIFRPYGTFWICFELVNYKYFVPDGTSDGNALAFVALIAPIGKHGPGGACHTSNCNNIVIVHDEIQNYIAFSTLPTTPKGLGEGT